MNAGDAWYEQAFDAAYLELYAHRDVHEAARATKALLAPLGLSGRRALDLACGGGRYTRAVAAHGAWVVGLDLSAELLHIAAGEARRTQSPTPFVRANLAALPFVTGSFDLVISMFTSFGYFASAVEDHTMLRQVASVLRPGGHFYLDVFNADRVRRELEPHTERIAGRFRVRENRSIDQKRNLIVKEVELDDGSSVRCYREEVRLWERGALEQAVAAAGFVVLGALGNYDGEAFESMHSPRLILHARVNA